MEGRRSPRPITGRRSPAPSSTAPRCWRWRRRRSGPISPRIPWRKCGPALRARVDCSLAQLAGKPDGAWVTVGGIVVDCKKIRTKSGSQMMFATLDDVEGQVEMLVFKADQAESAAVIQPDAIVLVRGRLDHKDRGETKLVVQEAQRFEPDATEIASAAKKVPTLPSGPLQLSVDVNKLGDPGAGGRPEVPLGGPQRRGRRPPGDADQRRPEEAEDRGGVPRPGFAPPALRDQPALGAGRDRGLNRLAPRSRIPKLSR